MCQEITFQNMNILHLFCCNLSKFNKFIIRLGKRYSNVNIQCYIHTLIPVLKLWHGKVLLTSGRPSVTDYH